MRWTAYLVLGVFGVALIAGVLGYLRVGRLLAAGILSSGALALMFYACVLVGNGLVGFALQVWPLRLLQMVQRHRDLLAASHRHGPTLGGERRVDGPHTRLRRPAPAGARCRGRDPGGTTRAGRRQPLHG